MTDSSLILIKRVVYIFQDFKRRLQIKISSWNLKPDCLVSKMFCDFIYFLHFYLCDTMLWFRSIGTFEGWFAGNLRYRSEKVSF